MNLDQNIHQMIVRLFTGEASTEERENINNWLNRSAENLSFFNDLKEIWLSTGITNNADHYDVEKAIKQFLEKARPATTPAVPKRRNLIFLRYAAIFLLAAAIPFGYYYGKKSSVVPDTFTTIKCDLGDRSSILLPDSSKVILNSCSQLSFNTNFKKGLRQVYLDGEAYFSVRKDSLHPFNVKTKTIEVQVLGTEFNLKSFDNDPTASATLVNGSLKVIANNKFTKIKPNQKFVYNKEDQSAKLYVIKDMAPEIDWKNGRLVFFDKPLQELVNDLERRYDIKIVFADELVKNRSFSGVIENENILEVMSFFNRSKYVGSKMKGNVITFYSE